jgi:hypothetical protein
VNPLELAELLTAPTQHPVREALRELAPRELDTLVIEALAATEAA